MILLACLFLYLALALFLYLSQQGHIYFPEAQIGATPGHVGVEYTPVTFRTSDSVQLAGWFIPAAAAKGTVLFCHGNGGNISYLMETVKLFPAMGYNLMVFDYRGYGESEGEPSEEGTYQDAEAAWEYLVRERKTVPSSIVVVGRSLGGAVAAWLAQRHTPHSLVLESTFTSLHDVAAGAYPWFPVRWMLRTKYPTIDYVREVRCPVLVIHSEDDEIIGFGHGRALFDAAREPKEFLRLRGGHNDAVLLSAGPYASGLAAFLKRHSGGE